MWASGLVSGNKVSGLVSGNKVSQQTSLRQQGERTSLRQQGERTSLKQQGERTSLRQQGEHFIGAHALILITLCATALRLFLSHFKKKLWGCSGWLTAQLQDAWALADQAETCTLFSTCAEFLLWTVPLCLRTRKFFCTESISSFWPCASSFISCFLHITKFVSFPCGCCRFISVHEHCLI